MSNQAIRQTVLRRVRLREELKPVKTYWHSGPDPDWLFITRVTGPAHETFDLQCIQVRASRCATSASSQAGLISWIFYETLRIAKGQAHADVGVEYVEWEPCDVEITGEDGSIDWRRGLPG